MGRVVMFGFGVFGSAVLTQPAVTQIEEVVGLVHGRIRMLNPQVRI
jgi:hypothetical protein